MTVDCQLSNNTIFKLNSYKFILNMTVTFLQNQLHRPRCWNECCFENLENGMHRCLRKVSFWRSTIFELSAIILGLCRFSGDFPEKPTLFPGEWVQSHFWYFWTLLTQSGAFSHLVLYTKAMELCQKASIYSSRYTALSLWELTFRVEFTAAVSPSSLLFSFD